MTERRVTVAIDFLVVRARDRELGLAVVTSVDAGSGLVQGFFDTCFFDAWVTDPEYWDRRTAREPRS